MPTKDSKDPKWEARQKAAQKELAEVCDRHKVNVIAYIDSFGPKLTIVDAREKSTDKTPGRDEDQSGAAPQGTAPKVPQRPDAPAQSDN